MTEHTSRNSSASTIKTLTLDSQPKLLSLTRVLSIVINNKYWKFLMMKLTRKTGGLSSVDHQGTMQLIWAIRTSRSQILSKLTTLT